MKRLAFAFLLLASPAAAQSTGNVGGWHAQNGPNGNNSPRANAMTASSATAGGSTSSTSVGGDRVIVAPALPGMASGPCTGAGGGLSVGVVGFTGGAGYTSVDRGCDARETARVAAMVGLPELAQQIMRAEAMRVLGRAAQAAQMPTYNAGGGQ